MHDGYHLFFICGIEALVFLGFPTLKGNGMVVLHKYGLDAFPGCVTLQYEWLSEVRQC